MYTQATEAAVMPLSTRYKQPSKRPSGPLLPPLSVARTRLFRSIILVVLSTLASYSFI